MTVLVTVAVGGWVIGQQVQSPNQAASRAKAPVASWITVPVERRVLSQTVISRGEVHPQVAIEVRPPSSIEGQAIVTNVGVHVGDEVAEGTRLVEVSGRPVFVMAGAVPVYRTLKPGMSGADVAQLQEALTRLDYTPDNDGTFGQATKDAVIAFYAASGYAPRPTSDTVAADLASAQQALTEAQNAVDDAQDALDKLTRSGSSPARVAAQNELDAAKRAVKDVTASSNSAIKLAQQQLDVTTAARDRVNADPEAAQGDRDQAALAVAQASAALDQARRDGASQVAAANDRVTLAHASLDAAISDDDVMAATRARDNAVAARDAATGALWTLIATTGPTVAEGEIVFAPTLPARVQAVVSSLGPLNGSEQNAAGGGSPSAGNGALVRLAGGSLVVSMTARTGEVGLVRVGMPVALLDEQTNTTYPASITDVGASAVTGADGQLGYPITLTPDSPLPPELAGVNVRVTITAASTQTATLVVPVAAVSSAADGSTHVSVLAAGTVEPIDVAVTVGLSADGFVAVTPLDPTSLHEGDRVVVGR